MIMEDELKHEPSPRPGQEPKHEPGKHEPTRPQEPDPAEPKQPPKSEEEAGASSLSLSTAQFQFLCDMLRRPMVDPKKEAQIKRMREHNRRLRQDTLAMIIARFHSCNHMQMPGSVLSGCAVIAWATQTDGIKRGTCQHCGTIFSPKRSECASKEIWEAYPMLVRIPTHPGGNINNIFMGA